MKLGHRVSIVVCFSILAFGLATAQDDIEIIIEPNGNTVNYVVEGVRVSGEPSLVRRGLLTEGYGIYADIDNNGTLESYQRLTYQVLNVEVSDAYRKVEIVSRDGQLQIRVDGEKITGTCDEKARADAPGACKGTGIPAELFGTKKKAMKLYAGPEGTAITVKRGVTLTAHPPEE